MKNIKRAYLSRFASTILLVFSLACLPISAAYAQTDADYPKRLEAAKAYAKTMNSRQMVSDMLSEAAKNPQMNMQKEDLDAMMASIDYGKMDQMILESMAKHFTEQELTDLGKFYSSPTGVSIMKKMPAYMADVMPFIQQSVMTAVVTRMQLKQQQAAPASALPQSRPAQ